MPTPKHDLSSLRIDDAQRKRSNVGKRLALLFGCLILLAGCSGAIFAYWSRSSGSGSRRGAIPARWRGAKHC